MEEMKKLLVIVTSVILILLIVYFTIISSNKKTEQQFVGDSTVVKIPESVIDSADLMITPDSSFKEGPITKEEKSQRDSVAWQHLDNENKGLTDRPQTPSLYFNPNKLFTNAAKLILPAVVSIQSSQVFKFLPENHPEFYPGAGSGIIISKNGYILTNFHVINEAQELHIVLYDQREFPAEYIGGDPTTDIALLKIMADDLPVAYMGNSDILEIGEWVLAVGNPLNFSSTITAGIISAKGRDINIIDEEYRIENFIQTDAVINPGNSGGALVNLNGEVIGVNTAIATRTGFNQGYGFAIPINLVKKVVNDIVQFGYVKRGLLGINIEQVNSNTARAMGLDKPRGVLIQRVRENYPADKVGLRQGDIILSVNGEEVNAPNELQMKIARNHPGAKVNLIVWRDGKEKPFKVELAEAPQSKTKSLLATQEDNIQYENLGLIVRNLSQEETDYLGSDEGVLVVKVYSGSPAQYAGIFQSDVIVSIDGEKVNSKSEFEKIIKESNSGKVLKVQLRRKFENNDIYNRIVFVEVP